MLIRTAEQQCAQLGGWVSCSRAHGEKLKIVCRCSCCDQIWHLCRTLQCAVNVCLTIFQFGLSGQRIYITNKPESTRTHAHIYIHYHGNLNSSHTNSGVLILAQVTDNTYRTRMHRVTCHTCTKIHTQQRLHSHFLHISVCACMAACEHMCVWMREQIVAK